MSETSTWIDLRDKQSGAKLKIDRVGTGTTQFLFIIGMSNKTPKWDRAIKELGFEPSPNKNFLIRRLAEGERIKATTFQKIWPDAVYTQMPRDQIGLNLSSNKPTTTPSRRANEERNIANELANARLLGRNLDGDTVYSNGSGRFIHRQENGSIVTETKNLKPSLFLRGVDAGSIDECADGFVRSLLMNEVLRGEDFDRFTGAVFAPQDGKISPAQLETAYEVIDSAITRNLVREYETANDAYGDSVRMYEYMPSYRGNLRGGAAMPIPLSAITQRLLGDTTGKTVAIPNAFDGASFAFLPKGTHIRAFKGKRDISNRASYLARDGLEWGADFHAARDANADAMIFNADMDRGLDGDRTDYKSALLAIRSTAPNARVVLVLQGDSPIHPGVIEPESRKFFETLYSRYQIEDAFEVAREITKGAGAKSTLRVISLTNQAATVGEEGQITLAPATLPVCHSWDQVKACVDESLSRAAIKEAQSDGINVSQVTTENLLQRPYIAFSTVREASTMVPKELQQPLHAFMSDLESLYGPVDEFVSRELGFAGENTLAQFSPEQVDALAMIIHRMKRGRGHILGDETGIGKGRTLAGLVTWALKQDHPVVFVTDRANLFSDLARDLRDIGEWGRVRPFVMNADGKIEDNIGDAGVLAEGIKPAAMRRILNENTDLAQTGCNVIFSTYSQFSGEDSEKAVWLKNQLKDALLIVDEAHVAAGSDSNISTQISEMTAIAWNVQYSSATWAKSAANLHIFARAFPESVNVGSLAKTMKRGGEAFSEIFSSMLAREGALIRREHDLSKLEFVVEVDTVNTDRNNAVADKIAEVMSALAFTAGALKRIVTRMSNINVAVLRDARDVRSNAQAAQIFKSRFGTGGMLYQVNRRVNAALNVENAVRLAIEGVEAGRKPVIVFEDTGESFVRQAMETQAITMPDGSRVLPEFLTPPTIKDLLHRIVDTLQMVRVEEVRAEDLPDLDLTAEMNEATETFDQPVPVEGLPTETTEPTEATETTEVNAAEQAPTDGQVIEPNATEAAAPPAPAVPVDEGLVVEDVVRALAEEGGETAVDQGRVGARPKKAAKRKFKLVPFWEISALSENDRKTFDDGLAEINALIESLPNIPLNAPDEISRRLTSTITTSGDSIRVGELSGRSFALQPQPDAGNRHKIIPRPKSKAHVNATVRAFNHGDIDVLMINRSAATGISLHASPRFNDRRRRQLTEMQIPENPSDRIQLYGRVNRFDQDSFPLIQVASTGIYGEVRQIMVQNKKLAEMSANVRSSRDSHALIKEVRDLLNPIGREVCRQFLEDNTEVLARLDLTQDDIATDSTRDLSTALTSRIPLLRIDEQRQTYEQLYAMFDDAIVQAELSGNNPLKPSELDVRAAVGKPNLLFGFDHKGLGSAFDGPVFAQRIDWEEDVRPMALEAIIEIVRVNREKLVASGKATQVGETEGGVPIVDISGLTRRAAAQLEGRARLAVAGTEFKSAADAMLSQKPNPVRRGMARAAWITENLSKLTPGRIISMPTGSNKEDWRRGRRNAVILDIVPPSDKRESQLAQWRVLTISPGEARPVATTLNALIGRLFTDTQEMGATPARAVVRPQINGITISAISQMDIGADVIDLHEAPNNEARRQLGQSWIYRGFEDRYVGIRRRSALVLTGNMYLASEWAAQTKAGSGVIFSDDRGLRHRGILLKDTFKPEWLRYLPTRLWMPKMIERFVERLNTGEVASIEGHHQVYSSFDGAWKATEGADSASKKKDAIVVTPGLGLMMHVGKESRKRVNAMLRQAQKTIKEELYPGVKVRPQDDPGHVMIKENKARAQALTTGAPARRRRAAADDVSVATRGDSEFVVLQADTPDKLVRAFQMLMRGPGLEIFVPPPIGIAPADISRVAKECMRDYYVERLREDAHGDPVRLAKLEELLRNETSMDTRAGALEAELVQIQASERSEARGPGAMDSGQDAFDFVSGEPQVEPVATNPESAETTEPDSVVRERATA